MSLNFIYEILWFIYILSCYLIGFIVLLLILFSCGFIIRWKREESCKKIGVLLIAFLVILTSIYFISEDLIYPSYRYYRVSIAVENHTDSAEDIVVYVPLPSDFSNDYIYFTPSNVSRPEPDWFREKERYPNYSIILTEQEKMVSVSTNRSLRLMTDLIIDFGKPSLKDDMRLTTQKDNSIRVFLTNTSSSVSINLYYETEYDDGIVWWKYRYIAAGNAPPDFEDSYHDQTIDDLKIQKFQFENQKVLLNTGWNEIPIFEGSFERST